MSRYLTPSKIGILCLTTIYCNGLVPVESTIPVLSLLISHLPQGNGSSDFGPRFGSTADLSPSISRFEEALKHLQSNQLNLTIFDILVVRLWNFISGIDGMFDFFATLSRMLAPDAELNSGNSCAEWDSMRQKGAQEYSIRLSQTSVLGLFVRKAQIEFARLQFQNTVKVWEAFQAFRRPSQELYLNLNPAAFLVHEDPSIEDLDSISAGKLFRAASSILDEPERPWQDGVDDVQRLLEFQIQKMQAYGRRLPIEMRCYLDDWVRTSSLISNRSFYLRFLEAWHAGDYHSSFEYLHQSYDYGQHQKERPHYQYALLNIAVLQADFSCYGEAAAAMQEAIATARENKDTACLHFCVNWLFHFRKVHRTETENVLSENLLSSDSEALGFLVEKAKASAFGNSPMYNVWTSALLSQAHLFLSKGEGIREAFNKLYQSSHINLHFDLSTALGSQLLLQSYLYARLGIADLASNYCHIITICYADKVSNEDYILTTCRVSHALMRQGLHLEAEAQLDAIQPEMLRTLKLHRYVETYRRLHLTTRLLLRNNLDVAEINLASLKAMPLADQDVEFETKILDIDLQMRLSNYSEAFLLIDKLAADEEHPNKDVYKMIRLLTLKAAVFHKCGRPEKGLSIAIRAAVAAWQSEIIPAVWEALAVLTGVLISISEFEGAQDLLTAALPQVEEVHEISLVARFWSLQADLEIGKAMTIREDQPVRELYLRAALRALSNSRDRYEKSEDSQGVQQVASKTLNILRLLGSEEKTEVVT